MRFIFTVCEKILRFIGVVDEFAEFYGDQMLFHNFYKDEEKMEEEIEKLIIVEQDKFNRRVLNVIALIDKQLKDMREKELKATFKWHNIECELLIKINKDLTKVLLPNGFPNQYFNFLRDNNSFSIDSEDRRYDIEFASLICENMDFKIIFKVDWGFFPTKNN